MTPTIRPAAASERSLIATLLTGAHLPVEGLEDAWLTLVATDEHGLAGVTALERYAGGSGPAFLLRSVAVRPDVRGNGLGRALVAEAIRAADREAGGLSTVGLLTDTADGYFDQFGFHPVDRSELPAALSRSVELQGACSDTARAYLRA